MQLSRAGVAPGPPMGPSGCWLWLCCSQCLTVCGPVGCSLGRLSRFVGGHTTRSALCQRMWDRQGGLGCGLQGPSRSLSGTAGQRCPQR